MNPVAQRPEHWRPEHWRPEHWRPEHWRPEHWRAVMTHTHTYSGREDHGGTIRPPQSYARLAAWARKRGIDALGMGSPYTPLANREFHRYDGEESHVYYGAGFDQLAVRGDAEILKMLDEANRAGEGETFYYLDNETPKGRYGHMWWVGYQLDFPAWHDYDQDFDRWMVHQSAPDDLGPEPMPYLRRPYREILAAQRGGGALGVWAHPTSWWRGDRGQFITNLATEMPSHAVADGRLDGLVIMGYHAHRPEYQALWFALLDRGYRVPGVAEMDGGLSTPELWDRDFAYLTLMDSPEAPRTTGQIVRSWRSGKLIVSSGPWIEISVDGSQMGGEITTRAGGTHRVLLRFGGAAERYDVELVGRGGQVLWSAARLAAGGFTLELPGQPRRGYLLARLFALDESGRRGVDSVAVANPVYLLPPGERLERPALTRIRIEFHPTSPYRSGAVEVCDAMGEVVERHNVTSYLEFDAPAGGALRLSAPDGASERHWLINLNSRLLELQRYLYRGAFLRDFPHLRPGEAPPEAWRLDEHAEALRGLDLEF